MAASGDHRGRVWVAATRHMVNTRSLPRWQRDSPRGRNRRTANTHTKVLVGCPNECVSEPLRGTSRPPQAPTPRPERPPTQAPISPHVPRHAGPLMARKRPQS